MPFWQTKDFSMFYRRFLFDFCFLTSCFGGKSIHLHNNYSKKLWFCQNFVICSYITIFF